MEVLKVKNRYCPNKLGLLAGMLQEKICPRQDNASIKIIPKPDVVIFHLKLQWIQQQSETLPGSSCDNSLMQWQELISKK